MPFSLFRNLLTIAIVEDIQEPNIPFDDKIDFWDYFYNEAKTLLTPDFPWHIKKP